MESYVSNTFGPCIILAGAGTGKTHSIIEKLKYIINKKIYSIDRVVCLTFSNEAVNTLRQRIMPFLHDKDPLIKTFHSFCADLLRKYGEKIDIRSNFKIILPDDGKILLHKYFKINPLLCNKYIEEIGIKKDNGHNLESFRDKLKSTENLETLIKKLEEIKFIINTAHIKKIPKQELEKLKDERDKISCELDEGKFIQTWSLYEKIKNMKNGLDYTDLHQKALELLNKCPEIANEFDYVIVAEFQDTNKVQCMLLDKIAKKRNITVVGDLNQSIYRFRGAYEENFSYFKEMMRIKKEDIYTLDRSYRSTNKILNVAYELIKNNYLIKEDCFRVKNAYNENGNNIEVYELKNSKEEVRKISQIIKDELKAGTNIKEICVIFRTHQQSAMLKKYLEYEHISFASINRESLLKTEIIKIIRSYLIIIDKINSKSNGGDNAWWEIVHNSRFNKGDELLITQAIKKFKEEDSMSVKLLNESIIGLSKEGEIKLDSIRKTILSLTKDTPLSVKDIVKNIYALLGLESQEDKKSESFLILEKFYEFVSEFVQTDSQELSGFIHHLNTIDALGISIQPPQLIKDGVRIMTNHATKGLEYEVVIMSSIVQKKFPMERLSKKDIENGESLNKQIMEERRLCYVGFTRTKKRLYLTYAKEYGSRYFEVSQFLKEINYQDNKDIYFIKDDSELYQLNQDIEIKPVQFEDKSLSFSPSALQLFDECQKRYEMKYIYNMPDKTIQSWESITLGNFIHRVLQDAVSKQLKTYKDIEDCAKLIQIEEYKDLDIKEAFPMIKVFFERNKNKYNENSKTEQYLRIQINGIVFNGYADRIDIKDDGEVTIIDYKTGKSDIKPKYRNWQLGIYAIAAYKFGNPKSLILEMLQKEHPLEFVLENGLAKEIHSQRTQFDLNEVKKEIVQIAEEILRARQLGFKQCNPEKNCQFCDEFSSYRQSC